MNRIRELRKKKGVTQKELAETLNIADSTLSYWEQGRFEPDQKSLFSLAEYFSVTIDYLLGKSDNPNPELLTIPDDLKDIRVAFDRGEFEDLTQDEVDALAVIARTLKAQRRL